MLDPNDMKRKKIIILTSCILAVSALALLSPLFHQEVPQNTIRILIDKPMDDHHIRIQPLIDEKHYSYQKHQDDFELIPPNPELPILKFKLIKDENTRALIFLKGEADVLYDSLSFAKTEWIKNKVVPDKARIYSSRGDSISELAFNMESKSFNNPDLKNTIIHALPVKLWAETVFSNWIEVLKPETNSSIQSFPNTTLHYLSTSSREGQQMAFLTREALGKIGIQLEIHIYEPSLFYSKIRKKEFDLFSSTRLPGMKNILDLPHIQTVPLFRWKHGLILNSRVTAPASISAELDYSFRFLSQLQLH
jgi:ABC-type transport system substrate-binding protein